MMRLLLTFLTSSLFFIYSHVWAMNTMPPVAYVAPYGSTIALVDPTADKYITSVTESFGGMVTLLRKNPQNKFLYGKAGLYSSRNIFVLDSTTNKIITYFAGIPYGDAFISDLDLTPDGKKIYMTVYSPLNPSHNAVLIGETATNTVTGIVKGLVTSSYPRVVKFSPDGKRAIIISADQGSTDGRMGYIDVASDSMIRETRISPSITNHNQLTFSADGNYLYLLGGNVHFVIKYNLNTGGYSYIDGAWGGSFLTLSADGKKLYVGGAWDLEHNGWLYEVDTSTDKILRVQKFSDQLYGFVLKPNGKQGYVVTQGDAPIHMVDLETLTDVGIIENYTKPDPYQYPQDFIFLN